MENKLFTPFNIGTTEIKNRIVMAPMSLGYEAKDGTISERLSDCLVERAKGGVGLIIVDAVTVDTAVPYLGYTTSLGDDKFIAPFKKFTDKVHEYGAKVFPQITHPGPESISWAFGIVPVGPSVYHNSMGKAVRELSIDEIEPIIEKYGDAARRARDAGCDGVEFHCAHAYMLAGAFLSPLRNKRTDAYGGDLDGRARFALEAIRNMKEKAGEDFPILIRISGDERVPNGNHLNDMLYLAPKFVEAGIDAFEVSGGTQYEVCWKLIPCHSEPAGVNVNEARAIGEVVDVPVLVVGKINSARFAEHVVKNGYADAVVMGRPLLADPELPNKAREGRYEDIVPCASCGGGCITRERSNPVARCVINAALGREKEMAIVPADSKKKVLVIGGGPAGLEAARVAALRGHKVTILERASKLGGQINVATVPPFKQELSKWIQYLSTQVKKLGVDVRLSTEGTVQTIKEFNPDAVIVATGSAPIIPRVKGIETIKVVTGHDVLSGAVQILAGNVLVVGGGLVGCELTDSLLQNALGKMSVHIIDMLDDIAIGLCPNNRTPLVNRLLSRGVKISTSTKLLAIEGNNIVIEKNGKQETLTGIDHIVFCIGTRPVDNLSDGLKDIVPEVYVIGDADKAAQVLEAIASAAELARKI